MLFSSVEWWKQTCVELEQANGNAVRYNHLAVHATAKYLAQAVSFCSHQANSYPTHATSEMPDAKQP
jgi:hypothetical protein